MNIQLPAFALMVVMVLIGLSVISFTLREFFLRPDHRNGSSIADGIILWNRLVLSWLIWAPLALAAVTIFLFGNRPT